MQRCERIRACGGHSDVVGADWMAATHSERNRRAVAG